MTASPTLRKIFRPGLRSALCGVLAAGFTSLASAATEGAASAATPASTAGAATDDPYLWLESVDSPRAMDWVRAENEKTLSVLEKDPRFAGNLADALAVVQAKDRIPYPVQLDGRIFNFWQDADHVRGIWRTSAAQNYDREEQPAWKTVLDLDELAKSEHANWVWKHVDCEPVAEHRCLLSLSDGGEDAVTVREFDVHAGAFVAHDGFELPKGKQSFGWQDLNTLAITREWSAGELTTSGYPYIVKVLRRGEPLARAREVYRGTTTDVGIALHTLADGQGHQALVIDRSITTFEDEKSLLTAQGVRRLALPMKADVLSLYDGQLLVRIKQPWRAGGVDVPDGALVAIDLAQATAHPDNLHPVVVRAPGARESLTAVAPTRGALVVTTLDNVRGRAWLYAHGRDGSWKSRAVDLPDNASIDIVDTDPHTQIAYFSATGFLMPSSLWRLDSQAGAAARIRTLPPKFDASRDVVEQLEATSSDGTRVPYFIIHPKDMAADGSHPTVLYAYGGFEVPITPSYSSVMGKLWLERGGVYVVANIRGGGEFGPAWHEAGLKTRRQIIYDDFAAVARDLISRKITSPRRLGIEGGSNGGLLMGVEMTQHPELWNAVDIQVPLLDMLRFEQIAAGTSWTGEYGSTSVPEERAFLAKISPYNNLRRGVKYPQALVWTTTKDDRVGPQHARKYAARLSEYGIPYYYYEVIEGGHGSGANLKERAHTNALEFTYFARQLMDP